MLVTPFLIAVLFGVGDFLINKTGAFIYLIYFSVFPFYSVIDSFIVARRRRVIELKFFNKPSYYVLIGIVSIGLKITFLNQLEHFTIPTPAMEGTILVGDRLVVRKIQLNRDIKHNEVVVFKVPREEENNFGVFDKQQWRHPTISEKINYIKRCMAIGGDVVEIKNKWVYVNNERIQRSDEQQFEYLLIANQRINQRNFEKLEINKYSYRELGSPNPENPNHYYYHIYLTESKLKELKWQPYLISIEPQTQGYGISCFPFSEYTSSWTGFNYGPLTIPKEGMKIQINDSTLSIYGTTIRDYEDLKDVKLDSNKLVIAGKEVTEYTFRQDYYWMMGDNRDNSLDSRYWGFVPGDHIVGKGFFIWLSLDKYGTFFDKIRWKRFFKLIK